MKNKSRKIIISSLLLFGLLLTASNSIAVPVMRNIQLAPSTPKPLDEVTFTADVEYFDYAKAVYLVVDEYKNGVAFTDGFNESMEDKGNGAYEAKIQLRHDDAIKISYRFAINVQNYPGVEWTESETTSVDLDTSGSGGTDDGTDSGTDDGTTDATGDSGGTSGTPGFELILAVCAIALVLVLKKRKQ